MPFMNQELIGQSSISKCPLQLIVILMLTAVSGRALTINVNYDSSVVSSPDSASIQSGFAWAVQTFQNQFTNPVTVNLTVYWGATGPFYQGISLGASSTSLVGYFSYADLKMALRNARCSAADTNSVASLPTVNPIGTNQWLIPRAEAKALKFLTANDPASDGAVGFASDVNYTFNPTNRAVPGKYDFIGVAEHEISEVLGRGFGLGYYGGGYQPNDLFRFSAYGVRNFDPYASEVYFSVDNGATPLKYFYGDINSGDVQDWASSASLDAYDAYLTSGKQAELSTNDFVALDILGYNSSGVQAAWLNGSALTGNRFQINFTNLAATRFTVLGGTNALAPGGIWEVLGIATEQAVGQYGFIDTHATNGMRLYRVYSP